MIHKISRIVKVLFQRVSVDRLLSLNKNEKIWYDDVNNMYLQDLLLTYYQQFSDTEADFQVREIQFQMNGNKSRFIPDSLKNAINVFDALFYYVNDVLIFHENRVSCKYDKLISWRSLSKKIGEDLPVIALMVQGDVMHTIERKNFAWSPVISHNNNQLKRILERGIADNHFHLRGSAPYFYVSWLNLMNHPERMLCKSRKVFDNIERDYRDKQRKYEGSLKNRSLYEMVLSAVLIRLYLFYKIVKPEVLENTSWLSLSFVEKLLAVPEEIDMYVRQMQIEADTLRLNSKIMDYMLKYAPREHFEKQIEYLDLAGERWFIYTILKNMLVGACGFHRREYQLFYAYLRLKNEIRSELIQSNELLGFANFQLYQKRKDLFTHFEDFKESEGKLARMAVRDALNNPAVKFLEVRIVPENTSEENMLSIYGYDNAIMEMYNKREFEIESLVEGNREFSFLQEDLKRHFYYVMHFTKRKDVPASQFRDMECRHYEYRRQIRRKAESLINFRKQYPQYAKRVVGIDVCGQEIGCRPEVFACEFRMLKNDISTYDNMISTEMIPQLKVTYHAGEDFLDVADGLRAIDEAIRFLNLNCGDRLGHALALGIDVKQWYKIKKAQITLTLQDYLDNIVWLHHALIKFDIKDMDSLKGWLEERYSQYFSYIYQECILQGRKMKQEDSEQTQIQGKFDIHTYYLSGLLRGDYPELYKTGKYKAEDIYVDQWEYYATNKKYIRSDDIRNIREVAFIYYMYHYNKQVRERGAEIKTFTIPENYIEGVTAVQKAMQQLVVEKGIAIETNPTSNVSIGIMSTYEEHPIKTFYNLGLTKNEQELMDCPQINVSINTDDKGVFATRLENEYALLACALEKEVMNDGIHKYKREFIYEWLNNIREMGIRQAFINDEENRWE